MRALALVAAGYLFAPGPAPVEPARPAEPLAGLAEVQAVPFDPRWLEPFFATGPARGAAERFRLDDWDGAAAGFERVVARLPAAERAPGKMLLALAKMNRGDWGEAAALFAELHESYPLLAPYHAYHAARCHLRRGDLSEALAWAARVPPRTVPEAEAVLVKLDALATAQRWAELEAEAGRFLERFPGGPRRAEAMFRRGEALERLGRGAEAAELYRRIWAEAPLEAWSRRAEERLEALAGSLPPPEAARAKARTAKDLVTRGLVLFDRNQNAEAEATFAAALAAPGLDPDLACKAHFHRAQSVFKQRQRPRAAPFFTQAEAACRASMNRDLLVKSLYQGARCLANTGDRTGALGKYAKLELEFPDHSYADDARLRASEIALDAGDEAQAQIFLADLPNRYPTGDQAGEALWRMAFRAWQAGDLDRALTVLDENLRRFPREEIWYAEGRALYWKARILDRKGRRDEAAAHYARAVREYPLSVYALLALERMRGSMREARADLLRELRARVEGRAAEKAATWEFAPRAIFADPGFLRGVELARLGLGGEARRELAKLGFAAPESRDAARRSNSPEGRDDALWITAILLDRGRTWSASHAIPRYTLTSYRRAYPAGRGLAEWRLSYPRAFAEIVSSATGAAKVPPALQWAIMREESAFSPRIESFANALGLTQMLVGTAQRFSPTKVTRETLLDPAKNVEIGSRFLSFLLARYNGAAPLAIAGYNAGEGAVDRWLGERGTLELDEFMETIPFDETRNYTKRVLASYFAYSWLYVPAHPVPELSFALEPPTKAERVGRAQRGGRRSRP